MFELTDVRVRLNPGSGSPDEASPRLEVHLGREIAHEKWNALALRMGARIEGRDYVFDPAMEAKVRASLIKTLGTDGTTRDTVTLKVEWIKDETGRRITIGGFYFAHSKRKRHVHWTENPFFDHSEVTGDSAGSHTSYCVWVKAGSFALLHFFPRWLAEYLVARQPVEERRYSIVGAATTTESVDYLDAYGVAVEAVSS